MRRKPRAYRVAVYSFNASYGVPNPRIWRVEAWDAADAVTQTELQLNPEYSRVQSVDPWVEDDGAPR